MSDIAKEAGVSRLTVSVVLNRKKSAVRISDATRERVLSIARQMNYRHNEIATAIRRGTTNIIGVIGAFNGSYGLEMIKGIVSAADEHGLSCKLRIGNGSGVRPSDVNACLEYCVRGIICRAGSTAELSNIRVELEREKIPMVLLDSSTPDKWCSRVNSDDFNGGFQAARYLANNGFERILYAMHRASLESSFARWRYDGFTAGLGRKLKKQEVIYYKSTQNMDEEENRAVAAHIRRRKPDVIFCDNDYIALKTMSVLHASGIRIPEEISVAGFAGLDFTALTYPALTTVAQPFFEMGRVAVEELRFLIDGGSPRARLLETTLIKRQSVKERSGK
ncbi:MAG: HTH-type transcriptional regulator DegA [Lentisphaerae bacterium ADurb.Bin242]|nr:MAG: HTH-type transcriptional regulator DegA [Lentisphaerae bacterium ADurb.Bin242]